MHFCNQIHTLSSQNSLNMSCNLSQSRAEYRRKVALHKARNQNNNNKMYKPKTFVVTCRYCKEEGHKVGHFDKALGRFVTTCVKAIAASQRKSDYNKRKREKTSNWKNQVSQSVAKETGSDGWTTAGSKNKVSLARETEKPVLKFSKNRFALDEDSDEETEKARTAPATRSPPALTGAWTAGAPKVTVPDDVELDFKGPLSPPKLTRAPHKTFTPVNTDSSDDDAPVLERSTGAPPSPTSPVPECWGDAW